MFDYVLKNGSVLDGTGAAAFSADIGIRDGRIAAVGRLPAEGNVLELHGKTVAPGFIDIHRHGDAAAFRAGFGELELRQGLTTVINGNCGLSVAPIGARHRAEILEYLTPIVGAVSPEIPLQTLEAYLNALQRQPLPVHVGMLVGAGVLRADTAGYGERLTEADFSAIHRSMERALGDGAFGVSLGLGYAPECFYTTDELIHALEPLRGSDIPLTVHMREEGSAVDAAAEEMLTVAAALRCPLHISHLKAMGKRNWGRKIPAILRRLEQARGEGMDVTCDVYPYTAGSTQLLHIMPPELLAGGTEEICRKLLDPSERKRLTQRLREGTDFDNISMLVGWDNIYMSSLQCEENRQFIGKSVAQAASARNQTPEECVFDLLAQERCTITMIDFITSEEDIAAILRAEYSNVISDSTYPTAGIPHPRLYGTFARVVERYVGGGVLTLPEAIHKMTLAPAQALRLPRKGKIAEGFDADLVVFDPAEVRENGTYADPAQFASGIGTVFVGGAPALLDGRLTAAPNGQVLRRD